MKPLINKLKQQKGLKILIIRLKPIGDTVLISPVFRNIKKLYPQAKIEVIIYPFVYPVIKHNPNVDKVIILKRNNFSKFIFYLKSLFRSYDVIIDFINNPTSAIISLFTHTKIRIGNKTKRNFFYNYRIQSSKREYSSIRCLKSLKPLGLAKFDDYLPDLYLDKKDINTINHLLTNLKLGNNTIGLFVSAKYPTRQYTPENFAQLGRLIAKKTNYHVLFLFGNNDFESFLKIQKYIKKRKNIHFISSHMTLGEFSALIARLRFLITNDTGPKHIATSLKIPTLTIFGPTDERVWNPPDWKKYPTIRKQIDCALCNKLKCPKNSLECMTGLSPETVFSVFKKTIKGIK